MQKQMEIAKQLAKQITIDFKERYKEELTIQDLCVFLWFNRQNLDYKPKKESTEQEYIEIFQSVNIREVAIWKINRMCERVYS